MQQIAKTRITEPLALPLSESEQQIRDLELEISDLRDLVCDLLSQAALPHYIVTRAYRLIGGEKGVSNEAERC